MKKFFLLLIFLVKFILYLNAQTEMHFVHKTTEDGLSGPEINCIIQDRRSFIWIGTNAGVCRYENGKFTAIGKSVLGNFSVSALSEDEKGFLWIGTKLNGLYCYNPVTEIFSHIEFNSFPLIEITCLSVYYGNRLLIGSQTGLFILNTATMHFSHFQYVAGKNSPIHNNHITALCYESDTHIWVGTYGGLYRLNGYTYKFNKIPSSKRHVEYSDSMAGVAVSNLFIDSKRRLWVSLYGLSIQYLDLRTNKFRVFDNYFNSKDGYIPDATNSIAEDHSGNIWLGCWSRLQIFNSKSETFTYHYSEIYKPSSLSHEFISVVYADNNGWIWLGTKGGGINIYNSKSNQFQVINTNPAVHSINKDNKGTLWISTRYSGIDSGSAPEYHFKTYTLHFNTPIPNEVNNKFSNNTFINGKIKYGRLFALPSYKLYPINNKDGSFEIPFSDTINPFPLKKDWIFSTLVDKDGDLWVATYASGVYCINQKTKNIKFFCYPNGLFNSSITYMGGTGLLQDKDGKIWISTFKGLNCYDKNSSFFTHFRFNNKNELLWNSITDIVQDEYENIWGICTSGGIVKFDKKKQKLNHISLPGLNYPILCMHYNKKGSIWIGTDGGGLFNLNILSGKITPCSLNFKENKIFSILEDDESNLWAGTNHGLYKLKVNSAGSQFNIFVTNAFFESDGLPSSNFLKGAAFHDKDGSMFFSTSKGTIHFYPNLLYEIKRPNYPDFESLLLFNSKIPPKKNSTILNSSLCYTQQIKLNYDQNLFTLSLATPFDLDIKNNKLEYVMEGLNANWIELPDRQYQITFNGLSPGKYRLQVRAKQLIPLQYSSINTLDIIIVPPFWKTFWFNVIIVLLIISGIYILYRQKLNKGLQVELRKRQLAESQLTALRLRMNPHFIYNSLGSIQNLIRSNENKKAENYMSHFSVVLRKLIDNADKTTLTLTEELDALTRYLEIEMMRFSNKFSYKIYIDPSIQTDEVEIPAMLIQPFAENSVVHAFNSKTTNGLIQINFKSKENKLIVTVTDNGIGRKQAELNKQKRYHRSVGVNDARQRLNLLGSLMNIQLDLDYTDLYDEKGNACGTSVVLIMPYMERY